MPPGRSEGRRPVSTSCFPPSPRQLPASAVSPGPWGQVCLRGRFTESEGMFSRAERSSGWLRAWQPSLLFLNAALARTCSCNRLRSRLGRGVQTRRGWQRRLSRRKGCSLLPVPGRPVPGFQLRSKHTPRDGHRCGSVQSEGVAARSQIIIIRVPSAGRCELFTVCAPRLLHLAKCRSQGCCDVSDSLSSGSQGSGPGHPEKPHP